MLRTHTPRSPWRTTDATDGPAADALGQAAVLALTRLGGMPFLGGNSVRTLVNGDATFSAILSSIDSARDYVL
ncbi:hypothetical protein, partial [Escherichia coli]